MRRKALGTSDSMSGYSMGLASLRGKAVKLKWRKNQARNIILLIDYRTYVKRK